MDFASWDTGLRYNELAHHGIKGQKWGIRRFQNPDGTLTRDGRARYGVQEGGSRKMSRQYNREVRKLNRYAKRADADTQKALSEKYNKRAKIAGRVALGLAAAATGTHGLRSFERTQSAKNHQWFANYYKGERNMIQNKIEQYISDMNDKGVKINFDTDKTITSLLESRDYAHSKFVNRNRQYLDYKDTSSFKTTPVSTVTKALAGGAALAGGYAAYAKIRSGIAKYRSSGAGHDKQVAKYRKQVEKMLEQYSGTPFSKLVKQQINKDKRKHIA